MGSSAGSSTPTSRVIELPPLRWLTAPEMIEELGISQSAFYRKRSRMIADGTLVQDEATGRYRRARPVGETPES